MRPFHAGPLKTPHPYAWLWEPLEEDVGFVLRSMFGAKAAYLDGKLMLLFMAKTEPWQGILVATDREKHPSLLAEFPRLTPHEVLGKWLYLPETDEAFERIAEKLVRLVLFRDPRIGVFPQPKKKKKAGTKRKARIKR